MTATKQKQYEANEPKAGLSDPMVERINEIYQAVYQCACILAEKEIEWDMSIIGIVADYMSSVLHRHGYRIRYPSVVTEKDGSQYIEGYYNP